jgi:hypothetical protein
VFVGTSNAALDGAYLFANYASGPRSQPVVDCKSFTAWEAARAAAASADSYENSSRAFVNTALGGAAAAEDLTADEALVLSDFARVCVFLLLLHDNCRHLTNHNQSAFRCFIVVGS